MTFMVAVAGAASGLGLLLVRLGAKGQMLLGRRSQWTRRFVTGSSVASVGIGLAVLLLTGWLVVSFAAIAATIVVTRASGRTGGARDNEEIAEAVALWTEQLRDTLAAAHGLQQTLVATAPHAPARIAAQVQSLAAKLPYSPMAQSLREFADEIDHSSADFVAAALIAATEHEARDVGALLGHLARCSREEARMHQRIWVGRSRTRTAVRIISVTVVGFVGALFLLNREYLQPYDSGTGQAVLVAIVCVFAVALLLLQSGSTVRVPQRFLVEEK